MDHADLIQLGGLAVITVAAFLLWSIGVGLLVAGVAIVIVGVAEELR